MNKQTVDISQEQMKQAAAVGVQLLNTPGAVNVPSQMAITGMVGVLNSMLSAIMNGEVILLNVPAKQPEGDGKTPPDSGGEKKPDITPIESGKKAEG